MAYPMGSEANKTSKSSQNTVLFILPVLVLGFFIVALFIDFLGTQAAEIAKLIYDIEANCKAEFLSGIGMAEAVRQQAGATVSCAEYLPKVVLFFIILGTWSVVGTTITLSLADGIASRTMRFLIAAAVTVSVPVILMIKYFDSVYFSSYVSIVPFTFNAVPLFAIAVVVEVGALVAFLAYRYFTRGAALTLTPSLGTIFWASVVVFSALSLLFAFYPENLYDYVGSINIITLYVMLMYAFLAGLFYFGRKTGFPIAAVLLFYVFAINVVGLNHNYTVPVRDVPSQQWQGDEQFLSWLENRRDRTAFANGRYPIYVVASAGGGMYAAMRTAYIMNFLQQNCPAFAHHIFAISGVSGGALGSLVFAAQQQSRESVDLSKCDLPDALDAIEDVVFPQVPILDEFFKRDVISTIVGAGLFPEMLQRAIPFPIPELGRSYAFRKSLGENWRDAIDATEQQRNIALVRSRAQTCRLEEFFGSCDFNRYWNPAGDFPMLIFNATWVDAGAPVVLSNIDPQYYANSLAARIVAEDKGINLIDGASLSARFPIALPAGFLRDFSYVGDIRLVDGGYFDGSGLVIARAVKLELEKIIQERGLNADVHLLYLGENFASIFDVLVSDGSMKLKLSENALFLRDEAAEQNDYLSRLIPKGAELGAHAKALFRAREQQSFETIKLIGTVDDTILRFEWSPLETSQPDPLPCTQVPLAWYLAPCTQITLKQKLEAAVLESVTPLAALRSQLTPP